jgi:hypothetical protein
VVDQDGDRDPGLSLQGKKLGVSGRVFVGLRATASAKGEIADDGTIKATGAVRLDLKEDIRFYGDAIPLVDAGAMARDIIDGLTPIPGGESHEVRLEPIREGTFEDTRAKCAVIARMLP